ncbi:SpoIIE family protein phosphatase [Streptomyces sp. NPDC057579]|uniref:SpoIIE family protein phosphatase n=1 Tax=Streptomyces sp. NPDC057579 TaxID=3346172 RepID=UPI0036AB3CD2
MWVQLALVLVLVTAAGLALILQSRSAIEQAAEQRSRTVAETFAQAPGTVQALDGPDPTAALQHRTQQIARKSAIDALVVFSPQGIRYTHPDPQLIGKHVIGPYKRALTHGTFTRTFKASTGVTVISIAPVTRDNGSVAGLVSAGITVNRVRGMVSAQLPVLLGGAVLALALAAGGTVLVGRRLRRQTHGLGPAEMTRMYEHHDAVLHAVREGVVIMDAEDRLLLANDEARRLLELPPDADGRPLADLGVHSQATELLASHGTVTDALCPAGDRLLAVNIRPTDPPGSPPGSVATLRDTTELRALTGRAAAAQERLRLLHDVGAHIGTTLDVRQTAQEMADAAVPRFADLVTVDLAESVLRGKDPTTPAAPLRRAAISPAPPPTSDAATVALDEVRAAQVHALTTHEAVLVPSLTHTQPRPRDPGDAHGPDPEPRPASLITVPVRARGVALGIANFYRHQASSPFDEEDLALAEELVGRAGVSIDNARRYTRDHTIAVTLQQSLLPGAFPDQEAVETAHRYLPAEAESAGVGGDWFDVIPLPGARTALVVGDVVGHGLHAAATMGQLRTAVHNLAIMDLPPDELLGHLDELVSRIDDNAEQEADQITGATCLYAIYDPTSGRCTMATNGHPGPALLRPDGTVSFPDIPVSPPLGLRGEPFETAELELPEGSRLVLFTNGLLADRHRDFDTGLEQLRDVLSGSPDSTPEETCQAVLEAMLPPHPNDDIALLVARTRRLKAEDIAEWTVDRDPAAVARIRTEAADRLSAWGLDESSYATELILSELVTNAIRYGADPIRVRLIRARSLICEVTDGSSTAPHLRRAATMDEGGRGLYLVSRFAERWGTRYPKHGKTVWTEQPLMVTAKQVVTDTTDEAVLDQWDDSAW